jgi:hypothetical protein
MPVWLQETYLQLDTFLEKWGIPSWWEFSTKLINDKVYDPTGILLTMKDPGAGAITGFGALDAPAASRNVGAGSFVINAIDDSKAVINTAVSTVDYLVIG